MLQNNQISITPIAHKKMILHSLRYPSSKVYGTQQFDVGVLVGSEKNKIVDSYPLFHTPIVNPTFSLALDLVESNLAESLKIVGFYQFIEHGQPTLTRIVESNNSLKNMLIIRLWVNADHQICMGHYGSTIVGPEFGSLINDIKQGMHRFIVDVQSHFEEIQLDFRNLYLY